jgi:ubiquinone/menaquinone biosynthesis C-methylase UbiE
MRTARRFILTIAPAALLLTSCDMVSTSDNTRPETARDFPRAERPVAPTVSDRYSDEASRDSLNEAEQVMDRAGITAGMTVADIGAGEGYYTIRLSQRVGPQGKVLAQDVQKKVMQALADRVLRERLDNVAIRLGAPDDPRLPANSFDRVFLVHMYHEVEEPYAFLWRLWPALRENGEVIVVDRDRPTYQHGMPIKQLICEMQSVGFKPMSFDDKPSAGGYYASFKRMDKRPEPGAIKACAAE